MTTLEDEWIPWNGGECPVPANTRVLLQFRCERPFLWFTPADWWRWEHNGSDVDIIAYRVLP